MEASLEIDSGYNKMLINTSVASPNYSITTTSLDCASTSSDNFRGKVLTNASAIGGYTFEFASAASNTNTMIIFSTLATVVGTIAVYSLTNNSHPQEFLNDGGNRNAPESGDDEFEDDEIDEQTVQASFSYPHTQARSGNRGNSQSFESWSLEKQKIIGFIQ